MQLRLTRRAESNHLARRELMVVKRTHTVLIIGTFRHFTCLNTAGTPMTSSVLDIWYDPRFQPTLFPVLLFLAAGAKSSRAAGEQKYAFTLTVQRANRFHNFCSKQAGMRAFVVRSFLIKTEHAH